MEIIIEEKLSPIRTHNLFHDQIQNRDDSYELVLLELKRLNYDGPAYEVECVKEAMELINKARKGV